MSWQEDILAAQGSMPTLIVGKYSAMGDKLEDAKIQGDVEKYSEKIAAYSKGHGAKEITPIKNTKKTKKTKAIQPQEDIITRYYKEVIFNVAGNKVKSKVLDVLECNGGLSFVYDEDPNVIPETGSKVELEYDGKQLTLLYTGFIFNVDGKKLMIFIKMED